MGVPRLACMRPAAWLNRGPSAAHLHQPKHSRPSRGAKPRGADDTRPPQEWPRQAGSRRGGDIKERGTSRGAHDDQDQAGASPRSVLVSSLVQRGQTQVRSTKASGKGFHIGAMRPRPAGRQDGGRRAAHSCVTTRSFGRPRPPFVRVTCTRSLPSNLVVVGSLPAYILGRGPRPL